MEENSSNNTGEEASSELSMDQILNKIRGVITDDENEPLELTQELEKNQEETGTKPVDNFAVPDSVAQNQDPVDIFKDMNNAPKESVPEDDNSDIVFSSAINETIASFDEKMPETKIQEDKAQEIKQDSYVSIEETKDDKAKLTSLISNESAEATSSAIKSFMKVVAKPSSDGLGFRSGSTVEDLIIEIMKPYLTEWLDKNLPNIVKQIVEKEIHKLIPRDDE